MRKNLTKEERLSKTELKSLFKRGKAAKGTLVKVVFAPNTLNKNRFAVSLGKRYGTAPARNYAKRVLKEIYRENKDRFIAGYDLVVVAYRSFVFTEINEEFMRVMARAALAKER